MFGYACIFARPDPVVPLEIDATSHLLTDVLSGLLMDSTTTTATLQTAAQGLLDYAQTLTEGEELMFTLDVPYVPAQDTPIVLAQASAASAAPQPDYLLNYCKETESTGDPRSAMRAVDPVYMLANYLNSHSSKQVVFDLTSIKTTLLEGTKHGEIVAGTSNYGRTAYRYAPPQLRRQRPRRLPGRV